MVTLLLALVSLNSVPVDLSLTVDGVERKATVYKSSETSKVSPVVFVFHGFTGTGKHAAMAYKVHEAWPEATVVYPQGLDVSLLGRTAPGWQISPKMQGDRDLKFYDAMLAKVTTEFRGDPKRVYTCGMSNGAIFSYVLLTTRGETLAAAAPVAGYANPTFRGAKAKPILITHGTKDPLIRISAATTSRDAAIFNNGCGKTEKEWMSGYVQYTPVKDGNDVIWHSHEGGHTWPKGTTEAVVKFFKEH